MVQQKIVSQPTFQIKKRYVLYVLLCLVALYVVLPQLGDLQASLPLITHADCQLVLLAISSALLSYVAAAGVYINLAAKPLLFGRTVFMQFASMFVNRLLPAGLGGIGINFLYLRKQKHSVVQATSVVAANNTMGFIGHMLLLATLLTTMHVTLPLQSEASWKVLVAVFAPALILGLLVVLFPRLRRRLRDFVQGVGSQLLQYRKHPGKLVGALACSLILTLANVIAFQLSCAAVGVHISLVTTLLIFTVGLSIGTATPTPGSLGGIEAGLVTGLLVYHVPAAAALGSVLLYRLVTYWLPLVLGAAIFVIARRRRYF